ncbi:MAG: hypothetical protein HKN17_07810 [Rhodothermales bacterium]|nr:hypothetical protein [Rhodothermales bacterium]
MTPEEFQRIKEAEKAHLRKLKKLKEAVRLLERQKKISGAVTDMTSSMEEKLDEHRTAMEQVALDAARAEARLEIALEAVDEDVERRSHEIDDEEALREQRAKELIRQMKSGESGDPASRSGARSGPAESGRATNDPANASSESNDSTSDDAPIPDKTIGRMKP